MLLFSLIACPVPGTPSNEPSSPHANVTPLAEASDAELEAVVYAIGSGSAQAAQSIVMLAELDATAAEDAGLASCPALQVADDGLAVASGGCTSAVSGVAYEGSFTERGLGLMGGEGDDPVQARLESTGFELSTGDGQRGYFSGTIAAEIGSEGSFGEYDITAEYGSLPAFRTWGTVDCPAAEGRQVCDESLWQHHVAGLGRLEISDEAAGSPWRVEGALDGVSITAPQEGQAYTAEFDDGSTRSFRVDHAEDLVLAVSAALGD